MFELTSRGREIRDRLKAFIKEQVEPAEEKYFAHIAEPGQRWSQPPVMEELKRQAKAIGLWNLFLPDTRFGAGLSHLDYARLAELMGRSPIASEVFNCSAPDSGNMELLLLYGNEFQKRQWLDPLLAGEIRSAYAASEPEVSSSDANNLQCRILRDGDSYNLSGRKWWISGAMDPRCRFFIVLGQSDPEAKSMARHSMLLVPREASGVRVLRSLQIFGYDDAPLGHAEVSFDNVRVPLGNLLYGEGKGLEIAQGRAGPGRVHQCMRLIGLAERALAAMVARTQTRVVFGQPLARFGMAQEAISLSRCELDSARLLTLSAAWQLDKKGARAARERIAMSKILVPRMACTVIDRAIQIHGAEGLCEDSFLAHAYASARAQRLADSPEEVQLMTLARMEMEKGSP